MYRRSGGISLKEYDRNTSLPPEHLFRLYVANDDEDSVVRRVPALVKPLEHRSGRLVEGRDASKRALEESPLGSVPSFDKTTREAADRSWYAPLNNAVLVTVSKVRKPEKVLPEVKRYFDRIPSKKKVRQDRRYTWSLSKTVDAPEGEQDDPYGIGNNGLFACPVTIVPALQRAGCLPMS